MSIFLKAFIRAIIVLILGALLWVFITHEALSPNRLTPVVWVVIVMFYIAAFAAVAFWVHKNAIVGSMPEGSRFERKPSFVIPVCMTILLMVFIVSHATGNGALWAIG